MKRILDDFEQELVDIRARGQQRALTLPSGIDFASNDYLGLSTHPGLRAGFLQRLQRGGDRSIVGAPASRLLRGHMATHAALETRLATYKGTEAALFFSCGYMANLGLLSTVIRATDRVISDAQNHASIIDALRLARCNKIIIPHLDTQALQDALATPYIGGRTFVVTESLFSMDGDIAPLNIYADLCDNYGAALIVDDSHGIGVYGSQRASGLTESFGIEKRALAIVSTFGKALGTSGAMVAGPRRLIEYLINCARPFIFTTAVPPSVLYAVDAALDILAQETHLGEQALQLSDYLRRRLTELGITVPYPVGVGPNPPARSPIIPVMCYENQRATHMANSLREQGFDVRAIRPPTVAPNTARLRVSVHANHAVAQLDSLAKAIAAAHATTPIGHRIAS